MPNPTLRPAPKRELMARALREFAGRFNKQKMLGAGAAQQAGQKLANRGNQIDEAVNAAQ